MRLAKVISIFAISCISTVTYADETKYFSVTKSPLVRMDSSKFGRVVSQSNVILSNTSDADIACHSLKFKQDGDIRSASRKNSVDTQSELRALLNDTSTNVHVVSRINYCRGPAAAGVVGCAGQGTSIVVEDVARVGLAAVVWLHEFGHTQNLSRATEGEAHASRTGALMSASVSNGSTLLDAGECNRMIASSMNFDTQRGNAVTLIEVSLGEFPDPETPLEDLLYAAWIEGPPLEKLRELDEGGSLPAELRMILLSIEKRHLWANSVTALGLTGEPSDISFLISFFQRRHGDEFVNDPFVEEARLQVPFSIGYLSARFETSDGFVFLRNSVNPQNNMVFSTDSLEHAEFFATEVAKSSLMAIALSGGNNDAAIAAIEDARQANSAGQFDLGVDQEFFEGLSSIGRGVAELGLERYILERAAQ